MRLNYYVLALPVLFAGSALRAADSPVKVSGLTVEHLVDPMGIGDTKPRMSWKLQSDRPGEVQTAYEIQAMPGDALKTSPAAPLWSSGKVASDQSVLVPWGGNALTSKQSVKWTVRVWDKDDKASDWSVPATFELGLLNPTAEWKGKWITAALPRYDMEGPSLAKADWISAGSTATQAAGVRYLATLPADAKIASATLDVVADGLITLYINGEAIRQGSSSHTAPFHADFPTKLAPGKNVIAIGAIAVRRGGQGRNAIAAHANIELESGQKIQIDSDKTWKAAVNPAGNWFAANYDDAQWPAATVAAAYADAPPRQSADGSLGPGRYVRKTFNVKGPIAKARLYSTALGVYEAYVNGKKANDHVLDPGWTDYAQRDMVQCTDVTALLKPGENAIGALISDGWFAGRVGWTGMMQYAQIADHPSFNGQLEITYTDGTTDIIATDATWKGGPGEVLGSDQQLGESIDHRKAGAWDSTGFNDAAWAAATVENHNIPLVPQLGPPVRKLIELEPKKITKLGKTYVIDFGQNTVGHIRLAAKGAAGTTISVSHGEMLNPDGTVYTENLRPAISLDTFTLSGDANAETFEPHFTFHGFRYAEITGYPGELAADQIKAVVIGSDNPQTGTFECSNADVNRLYQNIVWGQRSNFISIPTDCPQRDERMGWMGDAQVFSPTATQNADCAAFYTKWIQDVDDAQRNDGAFNNVSPKARENQTYPVWADAGVIIPWVNYLTYGDKSFLAKNYDNMRRYIDFTQRTFPTLLTNGGVGDHLAPAGGRGGAGGPGGGRAPGGAAPGGGRAPGGAAPGAGRQGGAVGAPQGAIDSPQILDSQWYFTAAPAGGPGGARRGGGAGGPGGGFGGGGGANTTSVVDTAYFAHSTEIVAKAAALLGKTDDVKKYEQLHRDIIDAFDRAYVQADGTMAAGTQTTYVLALEFNLVPDAMRPMLAKHLTDDIEQRQHLSTGFVGVGFINIALDDIGRSDLAYKLLLTDSYPSWLYEVKQGATTMWERWDGYVAEKAANGQNPFQDSSMNSFNHYSFGAVGYWMYNGIGGIQVDEAAPGYKHFFLKPQFAPAGSKLTFAKASFESGYGAIASGWRVEGDQLKYDVTVPPNSSATLSLPAKPTFADLKGPAPAIKDNGPLSVMELPAGTYHMSLPASVAK